MMGSEADDIIEKLFESLLQKYQKGLKESMKRSEFYFDSVDILYYNLQKTSLKRIGLSHRFSQMAEKWKGNDKS